MEAAMWYARVGVDCLERFTLEFEEEGVFVEDRDTEALGFLKFGTSGFAGDNVVGFFGDTAADFSAACLDLFLCIVAGYLGKRTRQHKGFALKEVFSGEVSDDLGGGSDLNAEIKEVLDDLANLVLVEKVMDRESDNRADVWDFLEVIKGGLVERVKGSKVIGEGMCGGFADVTDAERKEKTRKRGVFAGVEALKEVGDQALACAFERTPLGLGDAVEIGEFVEQPRVYGLFD